MGSWQAEAATHNGGSGAPAPLSAGHVVSRRARVRPLIPGVTATAPPTPSSARRVPGRGHNLFRRQASWQPRRASCAGSRRPTSSWSLPGQLPAGWDQWDHDRCDAFQRRRDPGRWHLLFEGVAAGNGWGGDPIDASRAARIAEEFRQAWTYAQVHTAGFHDDAGFCGECDAAYCYRHWQVSDIGFGHCPRGHGKSLDPRW
jgi:hypothetical protein